MEHLPAKRCVRSWAQINSSLQVRCHISFKPTGNIAGMAWQYLKVEEGCYYNEAFKPRRIFNGDETYLK
jgi:hypothetical protein